MKKKSRLTVFLAVALLFVSLFTVSTFAASDCSHEEWLGDADTIDYSTCPSYTIEEWCSNCGETRVVTYNDGGDHEWSGGDVDTLVYVSCPTYTIEEFCLKCGELRTATYYDGESHSWSSWQVIKEASCGVAGEESRSCGRCGKTEKIVLSALTHSYGPWQSYVAATCEKTGKEICYCMNCGGEKTRVLPATGHVSGGGDIETIVSSGSTYTITDFCAECGVYFERTEDVICDTGEEDHVFGEWIVSKKPTCVNVGTEKRTCLLCLSSYETREVPALGHSFENGACSVCGVDKTDVTTKVPDETTKAPDETTSAPVKDHEHNLSAWKKLNEKKHVSECQDSDCAYKLSKDHLDKDFDKKCDDCGCDYSEDISLKSALGIALGAAVGFGILYMVAAIVRSGKER